MQRFLRNTVGLILLLICMGCAPIPFHRYVSESAEGSLVYASCPLNKHIPVAVAFARQEVTATVSVGVYDGRDYLEMQLAIPAEKTLLLDSGHIRLKRGNSLAIQEVDFPNVSLVDTPIVNSYSAAVAAQHLIHSLDAPLVGERITLGTFSSNKNYWLATHIDPAGSEDIWITLPGFRINGVADYLPELHFRRRILIGFALINC